MDNDYISREAAIALLKKWADGYSYIETPTEDAINEFNAIPAADVWPLQVGENITENNPVDEFVCSECGIILEDWTMVEIDEDDGERTNHEYAFRYCPNCGKPMK